ncbi:hypothetical protein COLO4_20805 [Corchorus olitorius]|uniref:Uncharacterized protein n=1 Tax=Corchorus olitorius TaxID=93759 RepID=A0A1R3IWY5_9ROSI|nr:hypothetical protein COLO4_20805 [Corchorus olitorius]
MAAKLINKDTRMWKLDNIEHWISRDNQQAIENIPLGVFDRANSRKWPYTKDGRVTVRLGYYAIRTCRSQQSQSIKLIGGVLVFLESFNSTCKLYKTFAIEPPVTKNAVRLEAVLRSKPATIVRIGIYNPPPPTPAALDMDAAMKHNTPTNTEL